MSARAIWDERIKAGLCRQCGAPAARKPSGQPFIYCDPHRAYEARRLRVRRERRLQGSECVDCAHPPAPATRGVYCDRHHQLRKDRRDAA